MTQVYLTHVFLFKIIVDLIWSIFVLNYIFIYICLIFIEWIWIGSARQILYLLVIPVNILFPSKVLKNIHRKKSSANFLKMILVHRSAWSSSRILGSHCHSLGLNLNAIQHKTFAKVILCGLDDLLWLPLTGSSWRTTERNITTNFCKFGVVIYPKLQNWFLIEISK